MAVPIIISQSRWNLVVTLLLFVLVAAAFAWSTWLFSHLRNPLWAYLGISLSAPIAVASSVAALLTLSSIVRPGTLTIDGDGLRHRDVWHDRWWAWSDIAEFTVFSPRSVLRSPGCVLKTGKSTRRYVSFGRAWEQSAEAIVKTLAEAKSRLDETTG